jgi:rare lipoprotein A
MNRILPLFMALLLAACGSQAPRPAGVTQDTDAVTPAPTSAPTAGQKPAPGGAYYLDDGPPDTIQFDLAAIPDAQPRDEALHRFANRPYNVLGRDYVPQTARQPFRQQGVASWYGRKFHGQKTSSGEVYDMFAMTAAHPTLPIPSFVRVTRPDTGQAVVVRVNDRGPFLHGRIIDLSYTAAWKLGLVGNGSGRVVVEAILPGRTVLAAAPFAVPGGEPESPTVLRDIEEQGGHFLQLGAFGSRENAEAWQRKLGRTLGQLGERLVIRSAGSLHRLQLGPWADVAEARRIAEQLRQGFELPSVLVK